MKREIHKYVKHASGCCPGHDMYPNDTYRNNRSKKARAKGKTVEHKRVRTGVKKEVEKALEEEKQIQNDLWVEDVMRGGW